MNDRKQHVIGMAHQLFIEKGFQSTSIQDILEYSGIAKGTFYNYFSSKNELLIALFNKLYKEMEKERDELLIGQDPANLEIFILQIKKQMEMNRANYLSTLYEEVFAQKDPELKQVVTKGHLRMLQWTCNRFLDIFGRDKEPYLFDCAVMFTGILDQNIKYCIRAYESKANIDKAVRYSVARLTKIVEDVATTEEQLLDPKLFDEWLPHGGAYNQTFFHKLRKIILVLKKNLNQSENTEKHIELLNFIQDELLHKKEPRTYLIESALTSLKSDQVGQTDHELQDLEKIVTDYFTNNVNTH
jgi:hypothetical protein